MTNKKIILASSVVAALAVGAVIASQYTEFMHERASYSKNNYPVDPALAGMTLSLSSGEILGVRISEEIPGIIIDISPDKDGRLVIDEPTDYLQKAFPDLKFGGFVVVTDGEIIMDAELGSHTVTIPVKEGWQQVDVIPLVWTGE